jgi:hypothetical protein
VDLKKPIRHENADYRKYIQMQPCCSCTAPGPSILHHCRKIDPGRPTQGKVSIYNGLPMCHACHTAEHNGMGLDILELYQRAFYLLRTWVEEKLDE